MCNWRAAPPALLEDPRPDAPVQLVRSQLVPDCMHGCHNILHGVLLPTVASHLARKGMNPSDIKLITHQGLMPEDVPEGNFKKRISDTLAYWKHSKFYQLLLPELRRHLSPATCANIEASFVDVCGMVAIAYTQDQSFL